MSAAPTPVFVTLVGEITQTTDRAVLFRERVTDAELWIPRSVLRDGAEADTGDTDILCKTWFARREGLA